jgi:hypothetical protein
VLTDLLVVTTQHIAYRDLIHSIAQHYGCDRRNVDSVRLAILRHEPQVAHSLLQKVANSH